MSNTPLVWSGDSEAVKDLALRLLALPYLRSLKDSKPQLLVHQLPDDWPLEISLPEASQIIGSLVDYQTTVLIETDLSPDAAFQFYRTQMAALGWEGINPYYSGGFIDAEMMNETVFCRSKKGPSLSIKVRVLDERTEVRLGLDRRDDHNSICSERDPFWREDKILPLLVHPNGVQTSEGGGSGNTNSGSANAHATVKTDIPAIELTNHYQTQIQRSGWTMIEQGQGGSLNWSNWSFVDEEQQEWRSIFFVLQIAESPAHFYLHIQANCLLGE